MNKSSNFHSEKTEVFYVSFVQRWLYYFLCCGLGACCALLLYIIPHIIYYPTSILVLVAFFSIVFFINSILLGRKFFLAFYAIKMTLDERGLKIMGGELNIKVLWKQLNVVSVERIFGGKSMVDALLIRTTDGREYKLFDGYTKSPQELLRNLHAFSQENGMDIIFYWRDETLS